MQSEFIINVNQADFEQQVIAYSFNVPVIVDFWAEWCAPCRVLGPILEREANEANGGFRLAKVNVDQNSNLASRYRVQSIPAVKAFREGVIISEFLGVQSETQIRTFIQNIVPSQSELLLEKAFSIYQMKDFKFSLETYEEILEIDPTNSKALLGQVKCLIHLNNPSPALDILAEFPPSRETSTAELLTPLVHAITLDFKIRRDTDDPLEAAYNNSIRLIHNGNIEAATDGLLDLLREDKHYRNNQVHKIVLGLLELMDPRNKQSREYRNELATIIF